HIGQRLHGETNILIEQPRGGNDVAGNQDGEDLFATVGKQHESECPAIADDIDPIGLFSGGLNVLVRSNLLVILPIQFFANGYFLAGCCAEEDATDIQRPDLTICARRTCSNSIGVRGVAGLPARSRVCIYYPGRSFHLTMAINPALKRTAHSTRPTDQHQQSQGYTEELEILAARNTGKSLAPESHARSIHRLIITFKACNSYR